MSSRAWRIHANIVTVDTHAADLQKLYSNAAEKVTSVQFL